jgi:hypothetical protein
VVELEQDDFDLLVGMATRYGLLVGDGTVAKIQRFLRHHGLELSEAARKQLAAHIIEHGAVHDRDQQSWLTTLRALQPRSTA